MMKFIFCIIAILIQPFFAFLVYRKQEKQKAALKMPLLYLSVLYLVIQIVVFLKVCIKIPDDYEIFLYDTGCNSCDISGYRNCHGRQ